MSDNSSNSFKSVDPITQWKWRLPSCKLVKKHELYCNLVQGKNVLHIGCTDHKELIDLKIRNNQFLHAKELSFIHPTTKEKVTFKSDLPANLQDALDKLPDLFLLEGV